MHIHSVATAIKMKLSIQYFVLMLLFSNTLGPCSKKRSAVDSHEDEKVNIYLAMEDYHVCPSHTEEQEQQEHDEVPPLNSSESISIESQEAITIRSFSSSARRKMNRNNLPSLPFKANRHWPLEYLFSLLWLWLERVRFCGGFHVILLFHDAAIYISKLRRRDCHQTTKARHKSWSFNRRMIRCFAYAFINLQFLLEILFCLLILMTPTVLDTEENDQLEHREFYISVTKKQSSHPLDDADGTDDTTITVDYDDFSAIDDVLASGEQKQRDRCIIGVSVAEEDNGILTTRDYRINCTPIERRKRETMFGNDIDDETPFTTSAIKFFMSYSFSIDRLRK